MDEKIREEKAALSVNNANDAALDQALIKAARDGDKNAYGRLVLKYQKRVYRFVAALLGRTDTAEDMVQEAFVKGYLALNDFEWGRPFYPWISTIARNLALNHIKREEREKPISEIDDFLYQVPDSSANPLERMIEKENDKRLLRAIMALPIQFRSVFILRMFEKMSYEEIARYLNISVGTVDSRLHRARERLIEALKDSL
ncbi:MAG: sigma-70 family RNA polymerase sigma factor [candidate division Zixibacteria bacterium]|nr:sigma-70 family RNA polymerase sigma factor [candidate division Zixibacteria bacterium]